MLLHLNFLHFCGVMEVHTAKRPIPTAVYKPTVPRAASVTFASVVCVAPRPRPSTTVAATFTQPRNHCVPTNVTASAAANSYQVFFAIAVKREAFVVIEKNNVTFLFHFFSFKFS